MSDQERGTERPATFREVFANTEYRALYSAATLSWFGDYLARAAVAALVYQRTDSVAASAAAFATSFLPWVVGGPLLAAIAERYRYRAVMVYCDLIRMVLIALVAVPGTPTWLIIALLFLVALAAPPAQAARSAVLPLILTGDRVVLGLSLNQSTNQAAQVAGYMAGAAMAPFYPRLALLIDAVTFGLSAILVWLWIRDRPPALPPAYRRNLLRETAEGFEVVFGTRVLRAIAVIVFAAMLFSIVPEGLAAAWAADLVSGDDNRGVIQGLIMVANPVGWIAGGLLAGRLLAPETRRRMIPTFAILSPLVLIPAMANPPVIAVVVMSGACGFWIGAMNPAANGLFVQALPNGYRARAFGVMQSGMQVIQGLAVLVTGVLADAFPLHVVVGVWSLAGVLLLSAIGLQWPNGRQFRAAIATATAANRAPGPAAIGPGGTGAGSTAAHRRDRSLNNHRAGGYGSAAEAGAEATTGDSTGGGNGPGPTGGGSARGTGGRADPADTNPATV